MCVTKNYISIYCWFIITPLFYHNVIFIVKCLIWFIYYVLMNVINMRCTATSLVCINVMQHLFQRFNAINYLLQYDKRSLFKSWLLYPWYYSLHNFQFLISKIGYNALRRPKRNRSLVREEKVIKKKKTSKRDERQARRAQRVCPPVRFHFFCRTSRDCEALRIVRITIEASFVEYFDWAIAQFLPRITYV